MITARTSDGKVDGGRGAALLGFDRQLGAGGPQWGRLRHGCQSIMPLHLAPPYALPMDAGPIFQLARNQTAATVLTVEDNYAGGIGSELAEAVNAKKVRRIYSELGLQLRNKTPKRRVRAKLRDDRQAATRPDQTWAMDFVHDQLATGKKVRVLTVVDTFSWFSPIVDPRFSYRAEDVVAALERACVSVGYPRTIRVDQGSEFISRDLDLWAYANKVTLDFSRPGKPTDNAFIEAFNGRFRAERLNGICQRLRQ